MNGDVRNDDRRMEALRSLQRLLDEAFRVPGTTLRFGLDPIIGLVPWAGDVLTAILSCAILVQAHRMRVPGIVQVRMLLNVAIDLIVGAVPLVGDVADVFWKSNTRNVALLERHSAAVQPPTAADWLFVIGVVGAVAALATVPWLVMYWIVRVVIGS